MVDCGLDWLHRVNSLSPTAIVLTHAHPDHAAGLARGAPCPVYATSETWALLGQLPVRDRCTLSAGRFSTIDHLRFKAFPVEHSHRAPAVGLRICTGESCLVYVPDVVEIPDRPRPLRGIDLYIGDGSTVRRSMARRKHGTLIGHAPITTQLNWCEEAEVRHAIFTHWGSPIVRGNAKIDEIVRHLGIERGIDAQVAVDGLRLFLGRSHHHTKLGAAKQVREQKSERMGQDRGASRLEQS
jgi:phosphoribosyl 1,2-cyclic phosphodiesterase